MVLPDRWDVGLVPFPFTDKNSLKKRPALALSPRPFNEATGVTILAMITKAELSKWPGDYAIADWQGAGLMIPSIVRLKVFTIENSLILMLLGRLKPRDVEGFLTSAQGIIPNGLSLLP